MEERDFKNNLVNFLGTTYHTFADPVSERIIKLRNLEYRIKVANKIIHKTYLGFIILTPLVFLYTINQISKDMPKNSYERIVSK